MVKEDNQFESQFNRAIHQIQELNSLTTRAHSEYLDGNMKAYKYCLDRIWMELRTYCDEPIIKQQKVIAAMFANIRKEKPIEFSGMMSLAEWDDAKAHQEGRLQAKRAAICVKYENFLRRIMRDLGFLGVKKEDLTKMKF